MDERCSRESCNCTETHIDRAGQRFCSATCAGEEQVTLADAICACEHADCKLSA